MPPKKHKPKNQGRKTGLKRWERNKSVKCMKKTGKWTIRQEEDWEKNE